MGLLFNAEIMAEFASLIGMYGTLEVTVGDANGERDGQHCGF